MKKKIIYPILSTFLLLALAACSSEEADVPKEEKAPEKSSRRVSKQQKCNQPIGLMKGKLVRNIGGT